VARTVFRRGRSWRGPGSRVWPGRARPLRFVGLLSLLVSLTGVLAAPAAGASLPSRPQLPWPAVPAVHLGLTVPPALGSQLWRPQDLGRGGLWLRRSPALLPATPDGAWKIQRTPNPAGRYGFLDGVSCAGPADCIAVGYDKTGFASIASLAERWNGTRWSLQAVPAPAGATSSQLGGVSCTAPDACTAVGYYDNRVGLVLALAERWNGTRWSPQATPNPAGSLASGLFAVSCTSAASCTAAGEYDDSAGYAQAMAESWNGRTWRIQAARDHPGAVRGGLSGISCTSAAACVAVGAYETTSGTSRAMAEGWDGRAWRILTVPQPGGATASELAAVSCTAPTACTATGQYQTSAGAALALAERWTGTRWDIQPIRAPAGAAASDLNGVSCTAPTACTAAGVSANTAGTSLALAEAWNGTRWAIQQAPGPPRALASALTSVSCTSARSCTAAGAYANQAGATVPLAEAWNGRQWSAHEPPARAGALPSQLAAVSCTSPAACVAVGAYKNAAGIVFTLAERWDGTRWAIQATPNPAGASVSELNGVSCSSADACIAVGSYTRPTGNVTVTLAERWNGRKWSLLASPTPPASSDSQYGGISCASAAACTAAGSYLDAAGHSRTLAEAWNGTAWHIQATPNPAGSAGSELGGVSCTSVRACSAAGDYITSAGMSLPLAEAWNGTRWRIQVAPVPHGSRANVLSGVSCTSARACTAAGTYAATSIGIEKTLVENWNGKSWRVQKSPNPSAAGTAGSTLMGVSCASPGSCAALGYYISPANEPVAFAEHWNGTRWRVRATRSPASAVQTVLFGVSCPAPQACTADGYFVTRAGIAATLVEATAHH
jgi:hypothetical protein